MKQFCVLSNNDGSFLQDWKNNSSEDGEIAKSCIPRVIVKAIMSRSRSTKEMSRKKNKTLKKKKSEKRDVEA